MQERTANRLRRTVRMRRYSVRSVVSIAELAEAIDAAEQAELPNEETVERVALEDRTLVGSIPTDFLRELAREKDLDETDYQTLLMVAENIPLYMGAYVEDMGVEDDA